MTNNLHRITELDVIGHTMVIASQANCCGAKIFSYVVGKGYCVSYSKESEMQDMFGFTNDMSEAIDKYNSINL